MLALLLSFALAADPAPSESDETGGLSIAGGFGLAQSTGLPVLGLDLAWQPSPTGTSLFGRIAPGWGGEWTYEALPSGRSRFTGLALRGPLLVRHELGLSHVVALPQQGMDVRVGLEVGGELIVGGDTAPIGSGGFGWAPKGLAVGEFVRAAKSVSAVGLRMGAGSVPVTVCDPEIDLDCIEWSPGFVGGIYAYVWAARKVQIEAEFGRTSWITVGYRL
ncbi:MAG: hypothetical protein EP330_05250 [Deltaproteobacteria bacterium]|nr:MAG: hypothetical protein EP330_05250 [Deltaproteobacteria bacterium]